MCVSLSPYTKRASEIIVVHVVFLAKTSLQGTVKGGTRQDRQRKRWEDNIREWTGLEFGRSQRAVENRENGENWLQNHLWCPIDPHSEGIDDVVFIGGCVGGGGGWQKSWP